MKPSLTLSGLKWLKYEDFMFKPFLYISPASLLTCNPTFRIETSGQVLFGEANSDLKLPMDSKPDGAAKGPLPKMK